MHVKTFRACNFRRLVDTSIALDADTTVFVGANNSGKTSGTHIFQLFLGTAKGQFQIYDFAASSWSKLSGFDPDVHDPAVDLPSISLDIWFDVDDLNLHRVVDFIPSLAWNGEPIGVRLEWAPKDPASLLARYLEARDAAVKVAGSDGSYKAWPANMAAYLTNRLRSEYEIKYYVLDAARCDDDLRPLQDYDPATNGNGSNQLSAALDRLLHVDFLHAQRHLSDDDAKGRTEELSKRLSRYYARHLGKHEFDLEVMNAITESESDLNEHFATVFAPMLSSLATLGYPGLANPTMVVKASLKPETLLSGTAQVHYSLGASSDPGSAEDLMLPDQYNGLGFKNLIYMIVEVLDFHYAWQDEGVNRAPVHLLMIEEPEAHLHAQLQQVFIRKIRAMLPPAPDTDTTQMVITTHSPHIIYERTFEPIRYFRRNSTTATPTSNVLDLATFAEEEIPATRHFLLQYLKLTHCDLFFADAAILVEGNVERLLLPLMIQKSSPNLQSCHVTILEVGGAFAHKFQKLIEFLGIPTLVITDLDSVAVMAGEGADDPEDIDPGDDVGDDLAEDAVTKSKSKKAVACMTDEPLAVTANETLRQWVPQLESMTDLLDLSDPRKVTAAVGDAAPVRVAYQTRQPVTWGTVSEARAARTLEEAFALANMDWCQQPDQGSLGLRVRSADAKSLNELHERIYKRVRASGFDKTGFALGVIASDASHWSTPAYIEDGLRWLDDVLNAQPEPVATAATIPLPAAAADSTQPGPSTVDDEVITEASEGSAMEVDEQ